MIVNRRRFVAKQGHYDEAYDLLKTLVKTVSTAPGQRIYQASIGPFGRLCWEWECENLAEYEKRVESAGAKITPELWQKWHAVTEDGGTNEIWEVESI